MTQNLVDGGNLWVLPFKIWRNVVELEDGSQNNT